MNRQRRERIDRLVTEVQDLLDEEQRAYDNLPEGLQDGDLSGRIEAALESLQNAIDSLLEAQGA